MIQQLKLYLVPAIYIVWDINPATLLLFLLFQVGTNKRVIFSKLNVFV